PWRTVSGILFTAYGARRDPVRSVASGLARRAGDTDRDRPRRARLCRASDRRPHPPDLYDDDALGWFRHVARGACQGVPAGACRRMAGGRLVAAGSAGEKAGVGAPRPPPLGWGKAG